MVLIAPTAPAPTALRISPRMAVAVSESPFTFAQEVYQHPGQMWAVDVTLPSMKRAEAEAWITLQLLANGVAVPFLYGLPASLANRGSFTGVALINGAGQLRSAALTTKGWGASAAGVLRDGDYIQLGATTGARLYRVCGDVNADGAGHAVVNIWPSTRRALADAEVITVINPVGLWRFSTSWPWDINLALIYGLSFSLTEVV